MRPTCNGTVLIGMHHMGRLPMEAVPYRGRRPTVFDHTNPAPSRDRRPWGALRFPRGLLGLYTVTLRPDDHGPSLARHCHFFLPSTSSSSASRFTADASDDVAEVGGLGFPGVWVRHSPPKRLRNASALAASGNQNRIWNCTTSSRFRPRQTGMRRSR